MFVLYSWANRFSFYKSQNVHVRILGFFDTYEEARKVCFEDYSGQEVYICSNDKFVCLVLDDLVTTEKDDSKLSRYIEDRLKQEEDVKMRAAQGTMRELDELIGSQFEFKKLHFIRDTSPIKTIRGQDFCLVAVMQDIDAVLSRRQKSKEAYLKLRTYNENVVNSVETFADLQDRMKETLAFEIFSEPLVRFLAVSDSAEYLEHKLKDIRESPDFASVLKHADLIIVRMYEFINLEYIDHTRAKRSSFTKEQDLKQTILRASQQEKSTL